MRYDGPFEIIKKISPVSYRLRMLAFYRIHPVLNIAHLERYRVPPPQIQCSNPEVSKSGGL